MGGFVESIRFILSNVLVLPLTILDKLQCVTAQVYVPITKVLVSAPNISTIIIKPCFTVYEIDFLSKLLPESS
jgi:hypothetical protein